MAFEMYGRQVGSVSAREWWSWQESIFGNVCGWSLVRLNEIAGGDAAGTEPQGSGVDVMGLLSFGTEESVEVPFPEKREDRYRYGVDDDDEPPVSTEAFEQLEREIGLGLLWKQTLGFGRGEAFLPKRGERLADYISRIQAHVIERGIGPMMEAYRCGVPIDDILGDEGLDASDMHYHFANWSIRLE